MQIWQIWKPNDYIIEGFQTVFPIASENCQKVRITALVKNEINDSVKIRSDLMNKQPSKVR